MTDTASPPLRPPRWLWLMPRIALFLSLLATATLLWWLYRNDMEEQRDALIGDVLWVEQNMRFQMNRNLEQLQAVGSGVVAHEISDDDFELRAQHILRNGQGLIAILLLDEQGHPRLAVPPGPTAGASPQVSADTFRMAQKIGQPQYSPYFPAEGAGGRFEVHVPLSKRNRFAGAVVGVYALRNLLNEFVPWWLAQKCRVSLIDDNGSVLASKSNVTTGDAFVSHQVPLDPPGQGLSLQALAYRGETRLLPALLVVTIVALSAAIVLSLWALRRHVQRRYQAESALRGEHAFRQAMEDSLLTGLRARDLAGTITYVNPAFCRMVGWSKEELIGLKPPMPYWPPEEVERIRQIHDGVLAGKQPREGIEVTLMRKNGERFDALIYEAPLINAAGQHSGWMASVVDVTGSKRAEELARQQQEKLQFTSRLVTMGELASTLAHELNQPLSAIASYNAGCLNKLEADEFTREEMIQVLRKLGLQAQRAGQIIRRIHAFVRRSEPNLVSCNINEVMEDALGLIEADVRKRGVQIEKELASGMREVMADRVMIEQAILNLIRNGIDAMGQAPLDQRTLLIGTNGDSTGVSVSIADRGIGIAAEVADKLYAPFFTTKEDGMGMGLNICRSIIELHKGHLWFETRQGGGTVFRFSLPAAQ
ncbi:MAG: PAS domain S-box protein [Rhodocyclaceae bacterium]